MVGREGFGDYGRSRPVSPGMILIGLGLFLLVWRLLAPTGAIPLLLLGGIFTGVSFARGARGFLIPGGILLGLGGGVVTASLLGHLSGALGGAAVVGGLGAGFWLVYLLDRLRNPYATGFGWARIPGSILLGVAGFLALLGTMSVSFRVLGLLMHWWPLLLIVGGIWLFLDGRRRRGARWS